MGRPSKSTTQNTNDKSLKGSSVVSKKFGDGVIINGQFLLDNPREVISVSPALDAALGGGFQVGSLVTIAGQPRTGKTTTVLHFAAKWQALGRKVVYLNAEHRLGERDLKGIPGLKPEEFEVVQSTRGKILTAEDFLTIASDFLAFDTDLLVIIDSISMLSEEREMVQGMGTETRGGSGKLIAQFCRTNVGVIPVNNHIVIGIAHLYSNTSGYGKKYCVSMGKKADYALSTSLYSEGSDAWLAGSGEEKTQIGQINHWRVERSPINKPNEKADSYLRYGEGIDETQEILKFAEDLSLIEVSGSWYAYPDRDNAIVRGQGFENFRQGLIDNPEAFTELKNKVYGIINA